MLAPKILIVALLLGVSLPGSAAGAAGEGVVVHSEVTIAVVPQGTGPVALGRLSGAAIGLLNPGLGDVPADQTWLDVSQGARAFDTAYDKPLDPVVIGPERVLGWAKIKKRAKTVSADLRPGLLASALARSGFNAVVAPGTGSPALIAANRTGRLFTLPEDCPVEICPGALTVLSTSLTGAGKLARERGHGELLIVIESPPADSGDQLSLAVIGPGFKGLLTSKSTRTDGYVLTTDLGPTILGYLGIEVPKAMTGLPITAGGQINYRALNELEGRYQQVGKRRGAALLFPILIWIFLAAAGAALTRGRCGRVAIQMLAMSVVLLPAALLLTAAISPSLGVERTVATILPVLVAAGLLRLLPGFQALAAACLLTVGPYAIDMLAGSVYTPKAVVGPNPGLGARFYGIGNELESTLMILTSAGVGAALTARRNIAPRRSAGAFLIAGLAGTVIFAAGRFGADVGAAIIFPVAAVIAAAFVLDRPRLAWLAGLVALVSLALVAAADALLGGESHFIRTVFDGSSGDSTGQVLVHRLTETLDSFTRLSRLPITLVAFGLIVFAWTKREHIETWLKPAPALRAGLIAAAAGSLVGALSNDSGALFIQVGVFYLGLLLGFAWATDTERSDF